MDVQNESSGSYKKETLSDSANGPNPMFGMTETEKPLHIDIITQSTDKGKLSKGNVGYHAGNLGKSECHENQAGSHRHTGGYGTGTYLNDPLKSEGCIT